MSDYKFGEILFTQEQIESRAAEIGRQISEDFQGEEVLLVGVLRGAVIWLSQICKSITLDTTIDFMAVSSYGDETKSSGVVKINKDIESSLQGKNVIIVEDVVDTGVTLNYLMDYLRAKMPKTLSICSLLDKPSRRTVSVHIDYLGFEVEDIFVIGYGLDVAQKFRNLPYITSIVE